MVRLTLAAAVLALAGCAVPPLAPPPTAEGVSAATTITLDRHTGVRLARGPIIDCRSPQMYLCRVALAADLDPLNRPTAIKAYVLAEGTDWVFFDSAYRRGAKLDFTQVDREVGSGCRTRICTRNRVNSVVVTETFIVHLPGKVLPFVQHNGFDFKAVGKRGEAIVFVPPHYVEGFLQGLGPPRLAQ